MRCPVPAPKTGFTGRKSYSGIVEATLGSRAVRFRVTVKVPDRETVEWELQPLDD
jgi:hypothetical protein